MVFTGAAVTTPAKCGCLLIHYSPIIPRVESQNLNLRKMCLTFANMLNRILTMSVHHATVTDVKKKEQSNVLCTCCKIPSGVGVRPAFTHHIKIPLSGHGSGRRGYRLCGAETTGLWCFSYWRRGQSPETNSTHRHTHIHREVTSHYRNDTAIDQANKSVQTQRKKIKCQTSIMLEVPGSPESYEETTDRLCTSFTQ